MLYHRLESRKPDPRTSLRSVTRQDTRAIRDYLVDPNVPLEKKSEPWLDIAEAAGVELPKTLHHKPEGYRTIEPKAVRRHYKRDEGLGSFARKEEKELIRKEADQRLD
jgi:hypothetical protein